MATQRPCYLCNLKHAKRLATSRDYKFAATEPVFCSVRCAADYGLLVAGGANAGDSITWCDDHGWYSASASPNGCPDCADSTS